MDKDSSIKSKETLDSISDAPPLVAHTEEDLMFTAVAFLISLFLLLYIYLRCINPTNTITTGKAQKFDQ